MAKRKPKRKDATAFPDPTSVKDRKSCWHINELSRLIFVAVPLYFVAQRQAQVVACDSSHQAVAPADRIPGQAIGPDRSTSLSDRPMTREK